MSTELIQAAPNEWYATGWVEDKDAVAKVAEEWRRAGRPVTLSEAAPRLIASEASDDAPVCFWQCEEKVLGRRLDTWNQGQVGSCVGFGNGREAQDLLLAEIAAGEPEQWPGAEVSPEVIYGGSRVEIGGGRINGDGSIGAWAADWLTKYGVVVRGTYGSLDLTRYSESTCRRLGSQGIPTDVEGLARIHPIRAAAMVTTAAEGWAALGAGKPIAVCSNRGFAMKRNADGTCSPSGVWNHCMGFRGRFVEPRNRRKMVVVGNSWGDYLGSSNNVIECVETDGSVRSVELPPGHFATTLEIAASMLAQEDSFAFAGLTGWAVTRIDWTP